MSVLPLDPANSALLQGLQSDYDVTAPDAHVIAQQIVYQGKKKNVPVPVSTLDFAYAITSISHDHTTGASGAPTLQITMQDPQWNLLDSGFFKVDPQGKLLDLDLNYPDGSRFWWRLHQCSPQQDHSIQLTFVPRIVAELMGLFGPIQVNRAKRTRAEFLKMLCGKVNDAQGPIEFYSRELDIKQPIGQVTDTTTKSSAKTKKKGKASKSPGLGANAGEVTVKGAKPNGTQQHFINLLLQTCQQEGAGTTVTQACVFAAICESDMGLAMQWNKGGYGGLLAGNVSNFGSLGAPASDAVATEQIKSFIHGGKGYNSALSQQHTFQDIGQLAAHVEGCVLSDHTYGPNGYGQYALEAGLSMSGTIQEAQAIVQAGGGGGTVGSGSAGTTTQPYYFQINAGEDYWTGMCRLAQEVAWELIVDGNRVYYDPDTELIKQKVAAVIDRDDPTTFAWSFDWVNRQIATNFQIQVACQLMEFCAGEVVLVKNFGPASVGSTANPPLPGRWLINEIQHNGGDVYSTFSLVQPTPPKPEPAPQTTTSSSTGAGGGGTISIGSLSSQTPKTVEAAYAAAQLLNSYHLVYNRTGDRTLRQKITAGEHYLDCSASTSWLLLAAGFVIPNQATWGSWAPVSGDYMADGCGGLLQAGPGEHMTIYANADHVFIRIHPQGASDMQGNTVNPFGPGFGFYPWAKGWPGAGCGPSPHAGFWTVHYPGT